MAQYRIHFTDNYGPATIEADNNDQYVAVMAALINDPTADDIWTESYDPDEGWQA